MKKFFSLVTALIMAISLVGILPSVAASAETSGDYEYTVLEDGTVEITGYTGSETDIEIPDEIEGKAVTSIGNKVFYCCESLESIIIPDSVTNIGSYAFWACHSLTSIEIPNNVTDIGESAFQYCISLKSVILHDSIINIGNSVFSDCDSLESITIPGKVTSIGGYVFMNCNRLTSITLPDSVTSIGDYAFYGCSGLKSITIPIGVKSIGENVFLQCSNLTDINVNSDNTQYSSDNGILFNYDKTELIQYPQGKKETAYTIPENVTSIGDCAFTFCESLTSITIPNGMISIGRNAFTRCNGLISVTIPNSVISIGISAFLYCDSLTEINIDLGNKQYISQDGVLFNYDKTELIQYPKGKKQTTYTVPSSVKSIGDGAFYHCDNLESIVIPNSVINMGEDVFESYYWEITIKCYKGSCAEQYAIENGMKYELIGDNKTSSTISPQKPNDASKNKITVSPINPKKITPNKNPAKPAKVVNVKVKSKKTRKLNVSWKKVSGATGYEVMYAKNNKFKGKKTVKVKKNKVTLKRLKSKKKYFVKVRAYKKANGNTYYGKWSKVVKKKAK